MGAEAWRAAGFDDLVVHARDPRLCAEAAHSLPTALRVTCVAAAPSPSSSSAVSAAEPAGGGGAVGHHHQIGGGGGGGGGGGSAGGATDALDHSLLDMVGLTQARAAGYRLVAFVDVDVQPLARREHELRAALQTWLGGSQALGGGGAAAGFGARAGGGGGGAAAAAAAPAYARLFVQPSGCDACPRSTAQLAQVMRDGRCGGGGGGAQTLDMETLSRVVGVPARMATVRVHGTTPSLGTPSARHHDGPFAGCLMRPAAAPFERGTAGACHGGSRANGTVASRRRRRLRGV